MARMASRWQRSGDRPDGENRISPTRARQGNMGYRILTILVVALVLAFLVWIPVEIWGQREADEVAPQQPGQQMQSKVPEPPPKIGGDVPTETPPSTPAR